MPVVGAVIVAVDDCPLSITEFDTVGADDATSAVFTVIVFPIELKTNGVVVPVSVPITLKVRLPVEAGVFEANVSVPAEDVLIVFATTPPAIRFTVYEPAPLDSIVLNVTACPKSKTVLLANGNVNVGVACQVTVFDGLHTTLAVVAESTAL